MNLQTCGKIDNLNICNCRLCLLDLVKNNLYCFNIVCNVSDRKFNVLLVLLFGVDF